MSEIDRKSLSPEGVRTAIDAAARKIADAGTSGCSMLSVVQGMSRQDVVAVFKSAQAKEYALADENETFANLEFSTPIYHPEAGSPEVGASVDLKAGPDSDGKINLMFYDTGRKTGGCTNLKIIDEDMIVK